MKAPELLAALSERNVQLWIEGDQLRYRAPKGVLIPEFRDLLLREKEEVMGLLRQRARESISSHPLSYAQQALWFINQAMPGGASYNVAFPFRICSKLNTPALKRVVQALMDHHQMLRTTYSDDNGVPVQHIHGYMQAAFNEVDASRWNEEELKQKVDEAYRRPFDLERGPLLRVYLFNRSESDYVFLMVAHHIAVDGWSVRLLLDEVRTFYSSQTCRNLGSMPLPEDNYTDYVQWQTEMLAGPEGDRLRAYWEKQLEGELTLLNLPGRRSRTIYPERRGASHIFSLNEDLTAQIRSLARAEGVTLYTILLSVYLVLLNRYSGQEDILLVSPVSGRTREKFAVIVGCFANLIVLRIRISADMSFRQLLRQTQNTVLGALDHQDFPLELLTELFQRTSGLSRSALFQVGFALQRPQQQEDFSTVLGTGVELPRINFGELELEPYYIPQGEGQVDLGLDMADEGKGLLWGILKYNRDMFDAPAIERMAGHFRVLLESIVADPSCRLSELPLLSDEELHQLLVEWNATEKEYPKDKTLVHLFEEQVERSPDAVAVIYEDSKLTYRELNSRSNQLAHHLIKMGVGPEVMVGLFMERSLEMVIGIYGVIKAGGAYVPLDPEYPPDRIAFMVDDTKVPVLLTQQHLVAALPVHHSEILPLDSEWERIDEESTENPRGGATLKNLAYVIYTSGSTGKPKGVMNEHRGIVNRLLWMQNEYSLTHADHVLQKTPFSFDVSVWEFFWPLQVGACLVVAAPEGHRDSAYLVKLIIDRRITTLHFVPSMLSIFLQEQGVEQCTSIKRVICSGEALSSELQKRFFERLDTELHNLYGPTEAAVDVTYWACRSDSDRNVVPIGYPVANTQMYVLDPGLNPVPMGCTGELYIGGVQVARGYLNRPELTVERFIRDPFKSDPNARLYKTGDLARYLPDGSLEYLGRTDFQIKIRGLRVELGEIEARLEELDAIQKSVVVLHEDKPGDQRLVAYYVLKPGRHVSIPELRKSLRTSLPDYMIPSIFEPMDTLALTSSGKVNRLALPRPSQSRPEIGTVYTPPRSDAEYKIATIWQQVLNQDNVGIHDNFFDLGGHSLLTTQLNSRLREAFGVNLTLENLFEATTVAEQGQLIETLLWASNKSDGNGATCLEGREEIEI